MGLILLEALLALFIFIAIVWWTMFSGRSKGELHQDQPLSDHTLKETDGQDAGQSASDATPTSNPTPNETRR